MICIWSQYLKNSFHLFFDRVLKESKFFEIRTKPEIELHLFWLFVSYIWVIYYIKFQYYSIILNITRISLFLFSFTYKLNFNIVTRQMYNLILVHRTRSHHYSLAHIQIKFQYRYSMYNFCPLKHQRIWRAYWTRSHHYPLPCPVIVAS